MKQITILLLFPCLFLAGCGSSNPNSIDGLVGSEVASAMEQKGFTVDKKQDVGVYSATCKNSMDGVDYTVDVYGSAYNEIESVRATAVLSDGHTALETLMVLRYVASLSYTGANADKAMQWVTDHYEENGATTTIGNAKFEIKAPSEVVRILNITKAK